MSLLCFGKANDQTISGWFIHSGDGDGRWEVHRIHGDPGVDSAAAAVGDAHGTAWDAKGPMGELLDGLDGLCVATIWAWWDSWKEMPRVYTFRKIWS